MKQLIAAEFAKVFAARLWLWLLLAATALSALYVSLAVAFGDSPDNPSPPLATPEGQATVFGTAQGASALTAVLGAIGLTGEYRHKTVTAAFLATPRRGRLVLAKLVTFAALGVGYAVASMIVVSAIAVPWLRAKGVTVTTDGKAGLALGVLVAVAVFAVVGVGVGALVREQVATVVGILVYLFVVEPIVTRIGALQSWSKYLPGAAEDALTQISQANQDLLAAWQGGLVLAAYGVLFAVLGTLISIRRDVA